MIMRAGQAYRSDRPAGPGSRRPPPDLIPLLTGFTRGDPPAPVLTPHVTDDDAVSGLNERKVPPLDRGSWPSVLGAELRWLSDVLGGTRDAELLRGPRLHLTAAGDPSSALAAASIARIDGELTARYEEASTALEEALASPRYAALVDLLQAARARAAYAEVWSAVRQDTVTAWLP
jgi:hypothetical protein